MAASYKCDNCDVIADNLNGWFTVVISYFSEGPGGAPPGTRTVDAATPTLTFHATECRNAWCERAGLSAPVEVGNVPGPTDS